MKLANSEEACDSCGIIFGTHEARKRMPSGLVYHWSCHGKIIMKSFRSIGGTNFN